MRIGPLSLVVIAILFFVPVLSGAESLYPASGFHTSQTYTPHDAIEIVGDSEFALQGWPGSGTVEDPYLIEGLQISSTINSFGLQIRSTTVHFKISNCFFDSVISGSAMYLRHVNGGVVEDCVFENFGMGIIVSSSDFFNITRMQSNGPSLTVDGSYDGIIADCTISSASGNGITITDSARIEVTENEVTNCDSSGIYANSLDNSYFRNNILESNLEWQLHLHYGCIDNHIYGNTFIAPVSGNTVRDDGSTNYWDDGSSVGNSYSDYAGIGTYEISGTANSVDNYPLLAGATTTVITSITTIPSGLVDRTFTMQEVEPISMVMRLSIAAAYISASFLIAAIVLYRVWKVRRS
jgi:parallel beta-helix repeat protein